MKSCICLLAVAICVGCKPAATPSHTYKVVIIRDAANFGKPGFHPENKEDFFLATNDTAAFDSASKAFYINRASERRTHNRFSISRDFHVNNSVGVDLKTVLGKTTRDSINIKDSIALVK